VGRPRPWLVGLVLLLLSAGGCRIPTPGGDPTQPLAPATDVPSPSPGPLATLAPSATWTPVPSETPAPTPMPTETATVAPSPSPTATPCGEATGRVVTGTFPSPIQGIEQRYRVYLPPCYGQDDRLYPTLYLFHGMPYTESHWDDLGIDEAADAGISAGTLPPFVIVLPFGGEIADITSGGDGSFEGVFLHDVIPTMEERYCIWAEPAGRAIGGLSRGGYWSLEIGFRHPEVFAAVGGHSAAIFADNAGPALNPLSTGADPRLIDLPIYLDIGETDYLRQGVFDLHDVMTAAGIPHVWIVNPGGHSDDYWREHAAEYLAWYTSHWPADLSGYPPAGGRVCTP
jgi:enterochelin esterase-like enzyme